MVPPSYVCWLQASFSTLRCLCLVEPIPWTQGIPLDRTLTILLNYAVAPSASASSKLLFVLRASSSALLVDYFLSQARPCHWSHHLEHCLVQLLVCPIESVEILRLRESGACRPLNGSDSQVVLTLAKAASGFVNPILLFCPCPYPYPVVHFF